MQGINENYWLCVTTALFTNKAQMNKVLVQRLLVNMWALLYFWNFHNRLKGVAVAFAGVVLHVLQILLQKRMKWRDANISKFIQLHWDVEKLRGPGWGGGNGCDMDNTLQD